MIRCVCELEHETERDPETFNDYPRCTEVLWEDDDAHTAVLCGEPIRQVEVIR